MGMSCQFSRLASVSSIGEVIRSRWLIPDPPAGYGNSEPVRRLAARFSRRSSDSAGLLKLAQAVISPKLELRHIVDKEIEIFRIPMLVVAAAQRRAASQIELVPDIPELEIAQSCGE